MDERNNNTNILSKIRCKYIIIKIFDNIKKRKLLNVINYNKKYQKLMKIKLNDYKKQFSKIEIEIIAKENINGDFINKKYKNKSNIYIYYNYNKGETIFKRNNSFDKERKIKIIIKYKIKSLSGLFEDCMNIKKINFIKFNNYEIKDMSRMFYGCSSLEEINFSNFNTNNVTDMSYMFYFCFSLKKLNLSNFNTNNVTNMNCLFSFCSSLKELNLSNFNTNNVTKMDYMFYSCSSLKKINLSNFKINNPNYMSHLFTGCSSKLSLICTNNLIKKNIKNFYII